VRLHRKGGRTMIDLAEDMIREVGLTPFRRDSLHRPIEEVAA